MAAAELEVRLFGRLAGHLRVDRARELSFGYAEQWADEELPPISQSLPVRSEPYDDRLVRAFFGNLLPEGGVRDIVASRLGVSPDDDFGLLAEIGWDCAGAITVAAADDDRRRHEPGVEWLEEAELERAIADLPRNPLQFAPDEEIRLSLAGAQDKMAVVVEGNRIGLPVGDMPSTHILKAAIQRFEATPTNEAFCLALAARLGLETPEATVRRFGAQEVLLIRRYDRREQGGRIEREHQEDFCQALGSPARAKYEEHGGPGVADIVAALRLATDDPALEVLRFLDAVFFNLIIGNHDAHAKNFSLLYSRSRPFARLAPLYDLLSTVIYGVGRSLPMRIGGEHSPERIGATAIRQLGATAGLGPALLRDRVRRLAGRAPNAADEVASSFEELGLDGGLARRIHGVVEERSVRLHRQLGTGKRAGAAVG
jgi:serine/threonine-protein kinase HipA